MSGYKCVCGHTFASHRAPGSECVVEDCACGRFHMGATELCPPCIKRRAEEAAGAQLEDYWLLLKPQKGLFQRREPMHVTFALLESRQAAINGIRILKEAIETEITEHTFVAPSCEERPPLDPEELLVPGPWPMTRDTARSWFYQDDGRRARSPEAEYGVHWSDGKTSQRYVVNYVRDTG
ncbi:MAG: hypothetical protein F4Z88_11235, partial [Chloroflexi bacterium]|nr:hypothetical protein [Chloroflexota bacterium]